VQALSDSHGEHIRHPRAALGLTIRSTHAVSRGAVPPITDLPMAAISFRHDRSCVKLRRQDLRREHSQAGGRRL